MAINPLAARSSDQNTLSMSDIMRIPVGSRVQAAQSSSNFVEMIINSLTPIQIAQVFPSYYRDAIPDVSNFITKNIEAKMSGAGRGYDQVGGGNYQETSQQYYSGEQTTSTIPTKKEAVPGWLQRLQTETGMTLSDDQAGLGNRATTAQQNKQLFLDALNKGGITDPQMRAAMAAVTEGESRFMPRSEQDYSNTDNRRIREIFKSVRGMSDANLTELKKNPEAFFNKVYGGKLGNAPDEGYKYRGRGYFQLTGKENYARYGKMLGIDLIGNPDLANDPQIAAQIAVAYINDRYANAPGKTVAEKVFRAVGNPVAETEFVKKSAFNTYMQSGEFAPGKVANLSDIDVQAAEASEAEPVGELPAGLDQKIVDYYNQQSPKRKKEILGMIKKIGRGDTTTGASKLNTLLNDPATVALDNQTSAEAIAAASVGIPLGERIIQQSVQFFSNEQGEFVGANEHRNTQKIMQYLSKSGQGWDPRGKKNAWCARFVNSALTDAGIQSLNTAVARDYLKWGSKVELDTLAAGDVLVEHKGRREGTGGHVGFFSGRVRTKQTGNNFIPIEEARKNGYDITKLQMYGGNQSDSVSFKEYNPGQVEGRRAPEVIADNEARRLAAAEKVQNEVTSAEVKQRDQAGKELINEGSQEQATASSLDQALQNVPTEEAGGSTLATGGKVLAPKEENLRITDESGKILAYANDKEVFSVDKNGDLLVEPTYYVDPSVKNKKVIDGTVGALNTGGKVRNPNAKSGEMSPDEVLSRAAMGETIGQGILDTALRIKGLNEVDDKKDIIRFLRNGGVGIEDPAKTAWCAGVVNSSINQYSKETGIDMSIAPISPKSPEEFKKKKNSTYTQYATSFLEWGQEVSSGEMLMAGDVLIDDIDPKGNKVQPHTIGGHVGLSTGNTRINPNTGELEYEMYGGNQGRPGDDVQNANPRGGMASVVWRKANDLKVRRSNEQAAQIEEMKARGLPIYANKEAYLSAQYEKAMASREGSLPEETQQSTKNLKGDLEQTAKPVQTAQAMAQGGFINEKDNLSVVNEDGATLAKINEGEMIGGMLNEGTGMRVVSNKTRLADDIVEQNSIDSPAQQSAMQQPDATPQKPPVMAKNQVMKEDQSWREMTANDSHQRGTQIRAFRRTKFMAEGYHFNRATPSSIA